MSNAKYLQAQGIQTFRREQLQKDELKKKKMTRHAFLKDQILNHDRIDLLMTEVLGYLVKDFHIAMYYGVRYNSLVIPNVPGKSQVWNLTLAPRGHGKSTILNIARAIHEILKNPNIRILIASKTDTNAIGFLTEIKSKLKRRELIEIFGSQEGFPWNDGNIRVAPRTAEWKEDTIQTVGIGKALASRHYDLIFADDLIDEFNSNTEDQRKKIHTWFFKVLDPTLEPDGGEISIIGTRYHPDDLLGMLIEKVFTKKGKKTGKVLKKYYQVYPALLTRKNPPPKAKERQRYVALWPSKFSVRFLLHKRRTQGSIIFNSQYQNDVEGMKGEIFKYDWFKWYNASDIKVRDLKIIQGVDLAIKQKETADKFAHVTIGINPKTMNIYVLDYYNAVTHYTDQKRILLEKHLKYDPIRVAIEANGYQDALRQDMQTDEELSVVRCKPIYTDTDKVTRAWKLSAYFERGQVWFEEGMHEIRDHLLAFPGGRYKDLFDALDIAIMSALGGSKKTRDKEPGLI